MVITAEIFQILGFQQDPRAIMRMTNVDQYIGVAEDEYMPINLRNIDCEIVNLLINLIVDMPDSNKTGES